MAIENQTLVNVDTQFRIKRVKHQVNVGMYPHWEIETKLQTANLFNPTTGQYQWSDVNEVFVEEVNGVEVEVSKEKYVADLGIGRTVSYKTAL